MLRLAKTLVALVVLLVVGYGGTMVYDHVVGTSLADHVAPLVSWPQIHVDGFSARLPRQPTRTESTSAGVTTTTYSLHATTDSIALVVTRSATPPELGDAARTAATASGLVTVASSTPLSIGTAQGVRYRLLGTTTGAVKVAAFGATLVSGDLKVVLQYDVTGHPTATPALFDQVLKTFAFSG